MDGNRRRPLPPPEAPVDDAPGWARAAPSPERVRLEARLNAALLAGWVLRYDPERDEYAAARELHTARELSDVLDAIEAAGAG